MGSITIPRYEYGHPKNEDYAYDLARQREMEMSEPAGSIGPTWKDSSLAKTLNLANEAARIHIKLGREQMALEFSRCKSMQEVAALCAQEVK